MRILVTYNPAAFDKAISGLDALAEGQFRERVAGVINLVGHEIHEALIDPLMQQTGLHGSTIPRAIHDKPAGSGDLIYQLVTRGGDISLKYFNPSEGGGGVSSYPRGAARFDAGAFMTSGRNGARLMAGKLLGGHVYQPSAGVKRNGRGKDQRGSWYRPIKKVKSGVYIPKEMVVGASKAAFERIVSTRFVPAVDEILKSIIVMG